MNSPPKLQDERLSKYPNIPISELFKVFDYMQTIFDNYSNYKDGFGRMVSNLYKKQLVEYGRSLLNSECLEAYNLARTQTHIATEDPEVRKLVEECLNLDAILLSFYWASSEDYDTYDALYFMMIDAIGSPMPPILTEFSKKHLTSKIERPLKAKKRKLHFTRDRLVSYLVFSLREHMEINPTTGSDKIHYIETGCSLIAKWVAARADEKRAPRGYKAIESIWGDSDLRQTNDANGDNFILDHIRRGLLELKRFERFRPVPTN